MVAQTAGWIALGAGCVGAFVLVAIGAVRVALAQRTFKRSLARVEETQRVQFDTVRFEAALSRISQDASRAAELIARARRAVATIGAAGRYAIAAARLIRYVR